MSPYESQLLPLAVKMKFQPNKYQSATIVKGTDFEQFLLELSTYFINLPPKELDKSIEDAQVWICKSLKIDFSALWQFSDKNRNFLTITHMHSPPNGPNSVEGIDASKTFPWILEKMLLGETLAFSNRDLPQEACIDIENRLNFNIYSSVDIPLIVGDKPPIGILTFDSVGKERRWKEDEVRRLKLVAEIFSHALIRKEYELNLIESNTKLSLAAESAEIGMWEMDYQTGDVWLTEKNCQLFGFETCESIVVEDFENAVHPVDWTRIAKSIELSFSENRTFKEEYKLVHTSSAPKWVSSLGKPYFDSDGSPSKLIGISIDISERKKMELTIQNQLAELALLKEQIEQENIYLREDLEFEQGFADIIGKSEPLKLVLNAAKQVADTPATVLLLGETGTGKGLIANLIHKLSDRCNKTFVIVNCATLPPNLIESELFGRTKGAFTGADAKQMGRFEIANNGTLFLDEIGELQLDMQAKLLRVLQDGEFERLGNSKTIKVDTRIIAATGRDLRKEVDQGRFREDLYYRLNVFPITIPPLRDRKDDVELLAKYFIKKYSRKMRKEIDTISRQTLTHLENYSWPGNVRELEHLIERSVILTMGKSLSVNADSLKIDQPSTGNNQQKDLASIERDHISDILKQTNWKIEGRDGAAIILDIHPSTLRCRLKKLGLKRPSHSL